MFFRVVLIGAGQLGSRYLQGLVAVSQPLLISVIEPNPKAVELSYSRWIESGGSNSFHRLQWFSDTSDIREDIDLAIVATASDVRPGIIRALSESTKVNYWIIEKVIAQSAKLLRHIELSVATSRNCWVNLSRRAQPFYLDLGRFITGGGPIHVRKGRGNWGIGCNAVHYLDLITWWSKESILAVNTSGLSGQWQESKRAGFFEPLGSLFVQYSGGSTLTLEAWPDGPDEPLQVMALGLEFMVDEASGRAKEKSGSLICGEVLLQSRMTASLVEGILFNGCCELPLLSDAISIHEPFLRAMLDAWNRDQGTQDSVVPIT